MQRPGLVYVKAAEAVCPPLLTYKTAPTESVQFQDTGVTPVVELDRRLIYKLSEL